MNKKWIVYVHVFPNNKKYFGITSKKPNARWEGGTGYDKEHQPVMYNAIQKYGWDNVRHWVLYEGMSFKDACAMEQKLIVTFKTNCCRYGNEFGYNMTDGGEGAFGHVCSKEAKEKMSLARLGKYKGKDCYKSKSVICDGIIYESITEFCNKNNLSRGMVEKWLRGKSAMKKEWYDKGLKLVNQESSISLQEKSYSYAIYYDGHIFNSQAEFARFIGKSASAITKWLRQGKVPQKYLNKGFKRIELNSI